ncbi:hypothetical protein ACFL6B_03780 [Thermodesulfobacteriota bacterium]
MLDTNYGFGKMEYFDLKYIAGVPSDTNRYGNNLSYVQPYHHLYKNILVEYVANSIGKKQTDNNIDSIESILTGKKDLLRSKIELLSIQLGQRKKINKEVMYQIDKDSCRVQNLIFEMGARAYHMGMDRIAIERMDFDLNKQKRFEEVSYFRDTGLLNKELKDTLLLYQKEIQNDSLMSGINKEVSL